jgi:hypothetical protein
LHWARFYGYAPVAAEVKKAGGHARNSIHNLKSGVLTRGVLIDVPRLKGVPYLEPDTPIYTEDLGDIALFPQGERLVPSRRVAVL